MRRWFVVVTAAAGLAVFAAPPGPGAPLDTSITSLPTAVTQGGSLHLTALAVGGYSCSLSVRYADGRTQALGSKRMSVFKVDWTWRVPANAAPGPAHAVLACGTAGHANGAFTVRRRLVPARVVVAKTGQTQVPHATDGGTDVSYGIVLVNTSPTSDAVGVRIGVDLLDGSGRVVGTDTRTVAAIPAGGTFYLGGVAPTRDRTAVASIRPAVQVGESKAKALHTPTVGTLRVTPHASDSGAYVDGQITNRASATLSSLAAVSTVFFNGAGRVIGGAVTVPPFALPPGASAAFEISTPVAATAIASVQGSVEPQFGA